MDEASEFGHVHVLQWWKDSGLKLQWSSSAMENASGTGYGEVLLWKDSGLELKYILENGLSTWRQRIDERKIGSLREGWLRMTNFFGMRGCFHSAPTIYLWLGITNRSHLSPKPPRHKTRRVDPAMESTDTHNLQQLLDGQKGVPQPEESEDYDVNHLDFGYVEKCTNVPELKNLLQVLRSGKEGWYFDLEKAIEDRLKTLDPTYRRTEKVRASSYLPEEIKDDLESWVSSIRFEDSSMRSTRISPVKINSTKGATRVAGGLAGSNTSARSRSSHAGADEGEILFCAEQERIKGNEEFRCHDYDEAILHYTRSLSLKRTAQALTNRALAYIKLKQWRACIEDASEALEIVTSEDSDLQFKAFVRRGTAFSKLSDFPSAASDFRGALDIRPGDKDAMRLLAEAEQFVLKPAPAAERTYHNPEMPRRILIEEIEE
ncbi:hypothetical protein BJ742DRAFT_874181, partial [Cladochytrium replicatum]